MVVGFGVECSGWVLLKVGLEGGLCCLGLVLVDLAFCSEVCEGVLPGRVEGECWSEGGKVCGVGCYVVLLDV